MRMRDAVETFEVDGLQVGLFVDSDPANPRTEHDNFGHMVCFHRRYDLGDSHNFDSPDELNDWLADKANDVAVVLPLYLYDHGGITMSTSGFSCPWDSGQVGVIYVTRKDIRENWLTKRVTKKRLEDARKLMIAEVTEYDQYLTGDVYGYVVEDADGEHIDSCWSFFGRDYAISEAKSAAKYQAEDIAKRESEMNTFIDTAYAL